MAKFFIDRPKFALVIAIIMVLGGIIGLNAIPVAEFPEITPPVVQVTASYPGASADVVEESVAAPIEAQVNGVDDMLYMSSTSTNSGDYTLNVTFAVGTDPDIAAVNVQNRVAIATSQLPQEVVAQGVVTRKQSTSMLLIIHLTSPDGSRDALFLSNYASIYLQDNLARLPGVGSVSQFGALDYGMRVWLDPDRLTALSLTTTDIANAIQRQNLQASAGQLGAPPFQGQTPTFQFTLQAKGRLTTVEEFGAIVVRANTDGSFVRLRDVARIELGSQAYSSISKLNGTPAAAIAVYQSPGANALGVAEALYAELERLEVRFPPGVEYQILYDTTDAVRASVQEVLITLLMTFALVVAVTFLFLADWRSTLIPTLAIPVSLIRTFAVMYAVGYSMNMITLFALILAIGIVVDDAIIVVENVQRIMAEKGLAPREATYQAMAEVTGPVIATTLVLLAVFVPVSFMPGITGELYRQFSVTIAVAVSLSSINALTLAPALCRLLLKPESSKPKGLLLLFSGVVDLTRNAYVALVGVLVRASTLAVVFIALVGAGVMYLFSATPSGFLPIEDRKALFVNIQLPDGAALGPTEAVVDDESERIHQIHGVSDLI
ncbi:MAG: efflux RND transporter permease subunit, partial [Candidatus Competibacterales bacterium]